MSTDIDRRALQILFDTYVSPPGSTPESRRQRPQEDFDYAKSKGLMFDPVVLDHAQITGQLLGSVRQIKRREVANAYLASLSTRRLDWRSALGSYAVFQHMPAHNPTSGERHCTSCGLYLIERERDFNVLNFERFKYGGVRHDQVEYAALDLKLFLEGPRPTPIPDDIEIFRSILSAIRTALPGTTSAALQSRLSKSLKSNKSERDVLICILGFCGILGTSVHPGYSAAFVPVHRRELPDRRFVDMSYPACWWRSEDGINESRLTEYFGHAL